MSFRIQLLLPLFCLAFCCCSGLSGQKVYGLPEAYNPPTSPYNSALEKSFFTEAMWTDREKDFGWRIVIDRTDVNALEKPGGSIRRGLKFGDGFYVDDHEGEWLHLVDGVPDKLKFLKGENQTDVGWVHKDNVLLWYNSLVNQRTGIHLKALLINKLDNVNKIPCENRELVRIYLHPQGNSRSESSSIYNFFFVYKIEGNRYLLGYGPTLKRTDPRSDLLGWVDQDRLAEWNTRVALEPNFTQQGYDERKANRNLMVAGFGSQFEASFVQNKGYLEAGKSPVWERDPVYADKEELSSVDPLRFTPDLMRYPLTNVDNGAVKLDFFRSAVCDQVIINKGCDPKTGNLIFQGVDPLQAAKQREFLERQQLIAKNFNVFFVVEASSRMAEYKDAISRLAAFVRRDIERKQDDPSIRFGALTYRDLTVSDDPNRLIETQKLTATASTFQNFIQGIDFGAGNTNERFPVQNYGLLQAINVANFNPYHTNIVIMLGTKGDFTYNPVAAAKADSALKPDRSTITDALNKYRINLFGIQCAGGELMADREFSVNLVGIIQDAANKHYGRTGRPDQLDPKVRKLLEESGNIPSPPTITNPNGTSELVLRLQQGTVQGSVNRILQPNAKRIPEKLNEIMGKEVTRTVDLNLAFSREVEKWKTGELAPKGYTPHMIEIMSQYSQKGDPKVNWLKEKYELYKEVFFAIQPKGAKHPTFSYVLFWTYKDLRDYQRVLNASLVRMGDAPRSDRREYLQEAYCDLLDRFTGGSEKKCEEYTIDEIEKTVQGVQNEGVRFTGRKERISDLTDQKVVKDERIEEIIGQLTDVNNRLSKLLKDRDGNFTFRRNESSFYWIKVSDLYF